MRVFPCQAMVMSWMLHLHHQRRCYQRSWRPPTHLSYNHRDLADGVNQSNNTAAKKPYKKIKIGRTSGYHIVVTQGKNEHDAILLGCNTDDPQTYISKHNRTRWRLDGRLLDTMILFLQKVSDWNNTMPHFLLGEQLQCLDSCWGYTP